MFYGLGTCAIVWSVCASGTLYRYSNANGGPPRLPVVWLLPHLHLDRMPICPLRILSSMTLWQLKCVQKISIVLSLAHSSKRNDICRAELHRSKHIFHLICGVTDGRPFLDTVSKSRVMKKLKSVVGFIMTTVNTHLISICPPQYYGSGPLTKQVGDAFREFRLHHYTQGWPRLIYITRIRSPQALRNH
jgi:hypothetical protein